jgi:hypothetical protein
MVKTFKPVAADRKLPGNDRLLNIDLALECMGYGTDDHLGRRRRHLASRSNAVA